MAQTVPNPVGPAAVGPVEKRLTCLVHGIVAPGDEASGGVDQLSGVAVHAPLHLREKTLRFGEGGSVLDEAEGLRDKRGEKLSSIPVSSTTLQTLEPYAVYNYRIYSKIVDVLSLH